MSDTPKADGSDNALTAFGVTVVLTVLVGVAMFTVGSQWEKMNARVKALEERVEKLELVKETP